MVIQIDGTNNVNKGAELMFCAICEEVSKRYPDATILVGNVCCSSPYQSDSLTITKRPFAKLIEKLQRFKIASVLRRLHLPYLYFTRSTYIPHDVNLILNAGGYAIGDVWHHTKTDVKILQDYLRLAKARHAKTVYLPQAFGPFERVESRMMANGILTNADKVFAREDQSLNNLLNISPGNGNLEVSPDFTLSIKGQVTDALRKFAGAILIVPNLRMKLEKGIGVQDYCRLVELCLPYATEQQRQIVLLNHEGMSDLAICQEINRHFGNRFPVVSGLSALETKGIISIAYGVVSSRFHATASALSSCIPSVSSSWSSKYQLLYKDFRQEGKIVDIQDDKDMQVKLAELLTPETNLTARKKLSEVLPEILEHNRKMWDNVFGQ